MYETPNLTDMKLPLKPSYLPITIISDGEVDWENLQKAGFDEEWLRNQLQNLDIVRFNDVFYFEWKEDEGVYLEKNVRIINRSL